MSATVLHVDTGRVWGGGQSQVALLLHATAGGPFRPMLAAPASSRLFEDARALGIETHAFSARNGVDPLAAARLVRIAKRSDADILHAHTAHAHTLLLPAAALLSLPLVVTRRNLRSPGPRLARALSTAAYRRASRVLCISPLVLADVAALGVPDECLALAPSALPSRNGAAPRALESEGWVAGRRPVLAAIGALEPVKGHAVLLEAFAAVRARFPDAVLLVAGDGTERAPLERRIQALGLGECVRLLGQVIDPRPILDAADLVVHPSRGEGLGLVVLEALAAERPVVTTATTGAAEHVVATGAGRVVPPDDVAGLARACIAVLEAPATGTARAARAARERVLARHGVDEMVGATVRAYEALAPRRAR